jgi:hypothetical protein
MTGPHGHNRNTQQNQANQVYATQQGNQYINQNTHIYHGPNPVQSPPVQRAQPRTGRALLVILAVDVAFFVYGATAYTGQANNPGDLGRAVIFLILLATTGTLLRRWVRSRY